MGYFGEVPTHVETAIDRGGSPPFFASVFSVSAVPLCAHLELFSAGLSAKFNFLRRLFFFFFGTLVDYPSLPDTAMGRLVFFFPCPG